MITSSSSPGSFIYIGSERVEIWLGVRLVRLVRRSVGVAAAALAWFVAAVPAISSAVRSRTAVVEAGRRPSMERKVTCRSFDKIVSL